MNKYWNLMHYIILSIKSLKYLNIFDNVIARKVLPPSHYTCAYHIRMSRVIYPQNKNLTRIMHYTITVSVGEFLKFARSKPGDASSLLV